MGVIILLMIVAFAAWLWFNVPNLINPWLVFAGIGVGTLPASTATTMAAILPVVMRMLVVFAFVFVMLMYAAFRSAGLKKAEIRP